MGHMRIKTHDGSIWRIDSAYVEELKGHFREDYHVQPDDIDPITYDELYTYLREVIDEDELFAHCYLEQPSQGLLDFLYPTGEPYELVRSSE